MNGTVVAVEQAKAGVGKNGKQWQTVGVVFKVGDKNLRVGFWGKMAEQAMYLSVGQNVEFDFEPESKEWNGKWFTELRGTGLGANSTAPSQAPKPQAKQQNFPEKKVVPAYQEEDDLPF